MPAFPYKVVGGVRFTSARRSATSSPICRCSTTPVTRSACAVSSTPPPRHRRSRRGARGGLRREHWRDVLADALTAAAAEGPGADAQHPFGEASPPSSNCSTNCAGVWTTTDDLVRKFSTTHRLTARAQVSTTRSRSRPAGQPQRLWSIAHEFSIDRANAAKASVTGRGPDDRWTSLAEVPGAGTDSDDIPGQRRGRGRPPLHTARVWVPGRLRHRLEDGMFPHMRALGDRTGARAAVGLRQGSPAPVSGCMSAGQRSARRGDSDAQPESRGSCGDPRRPHRLAPHRYGSSAVAQLPPSRALVRQTGREEAGPDAPRRRQATADRAGAR